MSEEKPSPVTFHEYDIPALNSWFAWSAALLLAVSVWMIWADYSREWKDYQRRFTDVEIVRTRSEIAKAAQDIDRPALEKVDRELGEAEKARQASSGELEKLERERDGLLGSWYAADQAYKFIKAELDVARYKLSEALVHNQDPEHRKTAQAEFDPVVAEVERRRLEFEAVDHKKIEVESAIEAIVGAETRATKEKERLTGEKSRLEKRLASIGHTGATGFVNDWFRNQPLVDFLAPTIKVRQVVLPAVHADVNFQTVERVDRCHTCHMAIDKPGYTGEQLAPEFRSHPRLDLLLGRNHPVERFGCTACHGGSGLAITFVDAAHEPRDAKQQAAWEDKRHWHRLHHWDFPMLPLKYTEANCVNCHDSETRIPGADRLNAGRQLIEEYGCFGCHKIDRVGFDELRKVGPEMGHIQAKVSKDWMFRWVKDPKSFRPATRMPRFWGNSNTAHATPTMNYPLRDDLEAEAVVRYLMERSRPYDALARSPAGLAGDAKRGRWVVENRGCKGCHVVGEGDTGDGRYGAHFGPDLNQVGSKLGQDWLYAWIRDPKSVWADTRMPDLRLTDQEALDATAYLLTLKNQAFEQQPLPDLAGAEARQLLEAVTYEYLRKEMTTADAKERLAGDLGGDDARYQYLGGKLIARYGCFGCHDNVPGFENAQRIGTELTTWASKLMTQLDFGLVHDIPHTKYDWLRNKLLEPRVYDQGRVEGKDPQDLFKMPNFQFTEEQTDLIVTAVMGLSRDYIQPAGKRTLDLAGTAMERGQRVIRASNCQGCHVVENLGGGMEKVIEGGKPFAPPVLVASFETLDGRKGRTEQGAKVQPDWFFQFLKSPTTIRPWLNVRMPTFGLSDQHASDVVGYFAHHAQVPYPYEYFDPATLPDDLVRQGEALFKRLQCISCHLPLDEAKKLGISVDQLAPNLDLTKSRLRYEWLAAWLKDPGAIQKDTRMPSYFYGWDEDEKKYLEAMPDAMPSMEAIRAYLQVHGLPQAQSRLASGGGAR